MFPYLLGLNLLTLYEVPKKAGRLTRILIIFDRETIVPLAAPISRNACPL